jgi:S-DNA-T family DNA segregation ATPase FtsK/SpoIIIE
VHFLLAASRRFGIPPQITSTLEQRIVLRQADADDYAQLGVRLSSRETPALPPGRGFTAASELVQCAVMGGSEEAEQANAIRQVAARAHERFVSADVPVIGRLPAIVEASSLPAVQDDGGLLLGIADSTLDPIGVRAEDGHFLVAGPARTGRTTALATIATSIRRGQLGWQIHFLAPRDAPKGLSEGTADRLIVGADECAEYLQNREWEGAAKDEARLALIIDDAEELAEQLDAPEFLKVLRRRSSGLWILLAAETDTARSWHEGFKAIRKHRHGLLLRPDINADGDILGARLPRFSAVLDSVGRGYLVRGEELDLVQVAK